MDAPGHNVFLLPCVDNCTVWWPTWQMEPRVVHILVTVQRLRETRETHFLMHQRTFKSLQWSFHTMQRSNNTDSARIFFTTSYFSLERGCAEPSCLPAGKCVSKTHLSCLSIRALSPVIDKPVSLGNNPNVFCSVSHQLWHSFPYNNENNESKHWNSCFCMLLCLFYCIISGRRELSLPPVWFALSVCV